MALYKESLLHTIDDDLAGRNQNWDDIDEHMSKKPADGVHGMKFRGALVLLGSAQSIPSASFTTVQWGTEIYDTDNIFNPANPTRLTVPEGASYVKISTNITFASNSNGGRRIQTLINGNAYSGRIYVAYPALSNADTRIMAAGPPIPVNSGDYFEIQVYQDSGGPIDLLSQTGTWFALEVII